MKFLLSRFRRRFRLMIPTAACLIVFFCQVSSADQKLVLFGGGPKPLQGLSQFTKWAETNAIQNNKTNILVITWATNTPEDGFKSFKQEISEITKLKIINSPDRLQMSDPKIKNTFLNQLNCSSGVFFIGGDQNRIMDVLVDLELKSSLQKAYESGIVFSGTSAGTAIMSNLMVSKELDATVIDPNSITLRDGLGLLPSYLMIDQHFIKRQRQNRAFSSLLKNQIGFDTILGIDEGSVVSIENGTRINPITGEVLLITKSKENKQFIIDLLDSTIEL